jgi:hypothetical protein
MPRRQPVAVAALTAAVVTVTGVAGAVGVSRHSSAQHPRTVAARGPATTPVRATRSQVRTLPPLRRLTPPDAMVTLARPATAHQLARLRRLDGVHAVTVADQGDLRVAGRLVRVLALDVAARGFTPRFTARSGPLWTAVLRGEMTLDYSLAGRMGRTLGATVPLRSRAGADSVIRVGAFATVGLGRAQAVVDPSLSGTLGLSPRRVLVVSAPHRSDDGLRADLRDLFGPSAIVRLVRPPHVNQAVISAYARAVIPASYLRLYRSAAATCRGLPWTVLAAIGTVETGNGANTATSSKGAMGPMQFLPSTFAAYAVDADGDGVANIQDPADAIYSAARYLCAWGAGLGGQSLYSAIFAYNHADWYVRDVIQLAVAYS